MSAKVAVGDPKGRIEAIGSNTSHSKSPSYMENAAKALQRAERSMQSSDFAGVIKECQNCVEQSIKALLSYLKVEFPSSGNKGHEVSNRLQEGILKLSAILPPEEVAMVQSRLAKAGMISKVLSVLREFSNYGDAVLDVSSASLFTNKFGQSVSEAVLPETDEIYRCVSEVINKLIV